MGLSTPPQSAKHWRTGCETVRQESISHRLTFAISSNVFPQLFAIQATASGYMRLKTFDPLRTKVASSHTAGRPNSLQKRLSSARYQDHVFDLDHASCDEARGASRPISASSRVR